MWALHWSTTWDATSGPRGVDGALGFGRGCPGRSDPKTMSSRADAARKLKLRGVFVTVKNGFPDEQGRGVCKQFFTAYRDRPLVSAADGGLGRGRGFGGLGASAMLLCAVG